MSSARNSGPSSGGATSVDSDPTIKKRKRVRFSCLICRYRKLKCDRELPCNTCTSANLAHMCQYEESTGTKYANNGAAAPANLVNLGLRPRGRPRKTEKVKVISDGLAKTSSPATRVGFRDNRDSLVPVTREITFSVSKAMSLALDNTVPNSQIDVSSQVDSSQSQLSTQKSPILLDIQQSALWTKSRIGYKKNKIIFVGTQSTASLLYSNPFMKKHNDRITKAKKDNSKKTDTIQQLHRQKPRDFPLKSGDAEHLVTLFLHRSSEGIPFDSESSPSGIFSILPAPPVCKLLLDRFLSHINPFYYIIDSALFDEEIKEFYEIRAAYESGKIKDNNIKAQAVRLIALVTIMIRLARLTLAEHWKPSDFLNDTQYDNIYYYGPKLEKVAEILISGTGAFKRPNLRVLQVYLCIKIHHTVSPEDGDGLDGSDSLGLTGLIVEMAKNMGLHRDPTNFDTIPANIYHLWRMLWGAVIIFDSQRACENQISPSINLLHSDTKVILEDNLCPVTGTIDSENDSKRNENLKRYNSLAINIRNNRMRFYLLYRNIQDRLLAFAPISLQESLQMMNQIMEYENSQASEFSEMIVSLKSETLDEGTGKRDSFGIIKKLRTAIQIENFITLQKLKNTFYNDAKLNLPNSVNMEYEAMAAGIRIGDCLDLAIHCKIPARGFQWYINRLIIKWSSFVFLILIIRFLDELKNCKLGRLSPGFQNLNSKRIDNTASALIIDKEFQYDRSTFTDLRSILRRAMKVNSWMNGLSNKYFNVYKFVAITASILEAVKEEIHKPETESMPRPVPPLTSSHLLAVNDDSHYSSQGIELATSSVAPCPEFPKADIHASKKSTTQISMPDDKVDGPISIPLHPVHALPVSSNQFPVLKNLQSPSSHLTDIGELSNGILNPVSDTRYRSPIPADTALPPIFNSSENVSVVSSITNNGDDFFSDKPQPFDLDYSESLFRSLEESSFAFDGPLINQDILSWFNVGSIDDYDSFSTLKEPTSGEFNTSPTLNLDDPVFQ